MRLIARIIVALESRGEKGKWWGKTHESAFVHTALNALYSVNKESNLKVRARVTQRDRNWFLLCSADAVSPLIFYPLVRRSSPPPPFAAAAETVINPFLLNRESKAFRRAIMRGHFSPFPRLVPRLASTSVRNIIGVWEKIVLRHEEKNFCFEFPVGHQRHQRRIVRGHEFLRLSRRRGFCEELRQLLFFRSPFRSM